MKRILLTLAGLGFTLLGLIGLLIPVLPGFLFFIPAALCFASAFTSVAKRLDRHPVLGAAQRRWVNSTSLPAFDRARLAFWLLADTCVRMFNRKGSRPVR
jgi:uncharacterized membrane protein YbaN (DUF454 family)